MFFFNLMATKINLENIQTLTDFKRNAKEYVERVKATKSPLVLTVNGKAEVVVQEARAFQQLLDQLEHLEEEVHQLKRDGIKVRGRKIDAPMAKSKGS